MSSVSALAEEYDGWNLAISSFAIQESKETHSDLI